MALILPFLPLLVRDLGLNDQALVQRWSGAILAAPFLMAAVMTPIWGWVGDRIGRKLMVMRALFGLCLSLVLMSFATSPLQLLVFRAVQGAISGFIPAAIALVSSTTPKAKQGYALGVLSSAQAGGVVVGPLMGGLLADWIGYKYLFYVTASLELLAALLVWVFVHEGKIHATKHDKHRLVDNFRRARRFPVPIVVLGLGLSQMALFLVQPFFALFVESFGVAPERLSSWTGVLFGITGLTMLIAAPLSGRVSDRFGRRRMLLWAFAGSTLVFCLQAWVRDLSGLFVLRLLQGFFAAGMIPGLYALIAHFTPETQRGGIMAFGSSATLLGGLIGPLVGGFAASHFGMRPVFLMSALLFGLNALNALRLPRDQRPRPPRARRSWEL